MPYFLKMPRSKNLSTEKKQLATRKLIIELYRLEQMSEGDLGIYLLDLYKLIFKDKVTHENFKFGAIAISKRILGNIDCLRLPRDIVDQQYKDAVFFLERLHSKKKAPYFTICLLANELISLLEKNFTYLLEENEISGKVKYKELLLRLDQLISSTRIYCPKDFSSRMQITEIERILENQLYSKDLRALIYRSESSMLLKPFNNYAIRSFTKKPYSYISHLQELHIISQYLLLLKYFKVKADKESVFPPQRTEVLECMQEYRGKNESKAKIHGMIRKIFDQDYGNI